MRVPLFAATLVVAVGPGCRRAEPTGTTTVRSGTPDGPRVTNVTPDEPASRLATELCRRAEACGQVGRRDARWPTLGACLADLESRAAPGRPGPWCGRAAERSRLDACLAAIRSATCAATLDPHGAPLPDCRAERLCGPGATP